MNAQFFGISFGHMHNIVYLPLCVIACFILLYRLKRSARAANLLAGTGNRARFLKNFSMAKQVTKLMLLTCGLLFLFIVLLHPQWDKKEELVMQEGRDVFIALDVSRSMLAKDLTPNRLEFAKNKIRSLLQLLSSERVGLILFSGATFVQCPLTGDLAAFNMYLDALGVETISSGTTAIDQAIAQALQAFKAGGQQRKHKLLVVFTDGEDFSSNLALIKQEAIEQRLSIFTIGVGTPDGAPVPLIDQAGNQVGHQMDKKNSIVISRLNEGILQTLAHDSGGVYIRGSSSDDRDLELLVNKVQAFEKEKFEDKKIVQHEQQYPYFLLVSFICFAIEWLL